MKSTSIRTKVITIGEDAISEEYPMLILFGSECPEELQDACVIHSFLGTLSETVVAEGNQIYFGDQKYEIKACGELADENLRQLGHVTLNFSDELEMMPGSLLLSPFRVPTIQPDDIITFVY